MKPDFCKPDWNHLWEVVSESEQLQTLKSDLTVCDVSLRLYTTKLKGLLLLSQLSDITQYTLDDASAPTTLPQQPVRLVINVAQSEHSQIRFGHLLKTVWTVRPKNQIWTRFESDLPAVWTQPKSEPEQ